MYSVCLPITLLFRFGWQTETEPITIFYFFYFFSPRTEPFSPRTEIFFPTNRDFSPRTEIFSPRTEIFSPRTEIFPHEPRFFSPTKFLEAPGRRRSLSVHARCGQPKPINWVIVSVGQTEVGPLANRNDNPVYRFRLAKPIMNR